MTEAPPPVRQRPSPEVEARVVERLIRRIDARAADLAGFARALIRLQTVNPPGDAYSDAATLIGERLAGHGFEVVYERALGAAGDSGERPRANLVAHIESRVAGPTVHVTGHLDVAPAGAGWSLDPFAGDIKDGRVVGRGAARVKGGIAAAVIALETLKDELPRLPGALEFSATGDGLSGGEGGLGFLMLLDYLAPPRVDHVIVLEATGTSAIALPASLGESPIGAALARGIERATGAPSRRCDAPEGSGLLRLEGAGAIKSLVAWGPGVVSAGPDEAVAVEELTTAAKALALGIYWLLAHSDAPA